MARVLIGYSRCEITRQAFERHGHEAWTCDLLPTDEPSNRHFQCDVWSVLAFPWDMAVLHPMCTYLTCSAAWAFKDPDFKKYPGVGYHQKVKDGTLTGAARRIARDMALSNFERLLKLPFPVAAENPAVSFINRAIRPPSQVIHPYDFGDDASKATGFWLTGGLPHLTGTGYVKPRLICDRKHVFEYGHHKCPFCGSHSFLPRWANQTDNGQNRLSPSDDRWLDRSKTWPGIANAMGDQWGRWLNAHS